MPRLLAYFTGRVVSPDDAADLVGETLVGLGERLAREVRRATVDRPVDDFDDLRAAVSTLRDPDREIIRLVYWDGFTLVEAARLLGMNAATVRSRHARARALLQKHLEAVAVETPR
jgi:RNA polymerase sigma-70 factor (ECF subfamily)